MGEPAHDAARRLPGVDLGPVELQRPPAGRVDDLGFGLRPLTGVIGAAVDGLDLAEEGVVVVVVTVALEDGAILTGPEVITRGWVYAPEAEALLDECADVVRQALKAVFADAKTPDLDTLQRTVRRAAGRFVNDRTKRKPMIVPVVMEA